MESLLLETSPTNSWLSWVLVGIVVLLVACMPIYMNARNKKETQKVQEQTNSLKVGDKVLTTSGVYGTITELNFTDAQKIVVIETGGKDKSFLSIDAYAIYTVLTADGTPKVQESAKVEKPKAEKSAEKTEEKAQEKPAKKVKKEKKSE